MKVVFADTFYWIALTLPGDADHLRARQIKIVTTEEVLTACAFFWVGRNICPDVVANVEAILTDPGIRIVPQSHESFAAGFELYRNRPDSEGCPPAVAGSWFLSRS